MTARTGVLVVTGGSRGIGAQVVVRAAAYGWKVFFSYLEAEGQADALVTKVQADGGTAYAVRADIPTKPKCWHCFKPQLISELSGVL